MNVNLGILAEDYPVGIDKKEMTIGIEGTENFARVTTNDAGQESGVDVGLDDIDEGAGTDVEALPVDDRRLRALQDAKSLGALLLNGDLTVGDVGSGGEVCGPRLTRGSEGKNRKPEGHHDRLGPCDCAVPDATYAPAVPVVKLAKGFREGEGFLHHDANW